MGAAQSALPQPNRVRLPKVRSKRQAQGMLRPRSTPTPNQRGSGENGSPRTEAEGIQSLIRQSTRRPQPAPGCPSPFLQSPRVFAVFAPPARALAASTGPAQRHEHYAEWPPACEQNYMTSCARLSPATQATCPSVLSGGPKPLLGRMRRQARASVPARREGRRRSGRVASVHVQTALAVKGVGASLPSLFSTPGSFPPARNPQPIPSRRARQQSSAGAGAAAPAALRREPRPYGWNRRCSFLDNGTAMSQANTRHALKGKRPPLDK